MLVSFLVSFAFIRTSARMIRSPRFQWWPGNVETGSGLHIHHLVWGISLLLVSGFLSFATDVTTPWTQITAVGFGIGAGLTLNEFARAQHRFRPDRPAACAATASSTSSAASRARRRLRAATDGGHGDGHHERHFKRTLGPKSLYDGDFLRSSHGHDSCHVR